MSNYALENFFDMTSSELQMAVIEITPDMAKYWLDVMGKNRTMTRSTMDKYASDIMNSAWTLNHQGIAFDCNRKLIDGQHRLHAIINTGISVKAPVFVNSVAQGIDVHRPRSIHDEIRISGEAEWMKGKSAATAAFMMNFMKTKNYSRGQTFSASAVLDFAAKNEEALTLTQELFRASRKGITQAAVRGVVASASYHVERDILDDFVAKLYSGIVDGPHESSVIRLREYLISASRGNGERERYSTGRRTCRALKAFVNGESLKALHEPKDMLYLLPKDKW